MMCAFREFGKWNLNSSFSVDDCGEASLEVVLATRNRKMWGDTNPMGTNPPKPRKKIDITIATVSDIPVTINSSGIYTFDTSTDGPHVGFDIICKIIPVPVSKNQKFDWLFSLKCPDGLNYSKVNDSSYLPAPSLLWDKSWKNYMYPSHSVNMNSKAKFNAVVGILSTELIQTFNNSRRC